MYAFLAGLGVMAAVVVGGWRSHRHPTTPPPAPPGIEQPIGFGLDGP